MALNYVVNRLQSTTEKFENKTGTLTLEDLRSSLKCCRAIIKKSKEELYNVRNDEIRDLLERIKRKANICLNRVVKRIENILEEEAAGDLPQEEAADSANSFTDEVLR